MINLQVDSRARRNNLKNCKDRGVIIPTYSQQKNPDEIPQALKSRIRETGLQDMVPTNLFRITWKNEPREKGGLFGKVNRLLFPPELTGVEAKIVALIGKWFPTGSHKVGAAFGCLAPSFVTGNFDSKTQKAVWPSTGNFCRGGAYDAALLGCDSIAILPEGMSRERFDWLNRLGVEVVTTPGCESNIKEVFDFCKELKRIRGDQVVVFNQFEEFGNYLWHYEVTGCAVSEVVEEELRGSGRFAGFVSLVGSAGTIAAGDYLKNKYREVKVCAGEALQCPTMLNNGFGDHRIEGIGDKHVPWIYNVRNTDIVIAVEDQDCLAVMRLFNEPQGREYLAENGVQKEILSSLHLLGISGIGNLLASIKFSKYYELGSKDLVVTILTDSMDLYTSRLVEARDRLGEFKRADAVKELCRIRYLGTDNLLELNHRQRRRIHNLKYFTWVEQHGKSVDELNRQWYDEEYWADIQAQATQIDQLITEFNEEADI